MEHTHNQDRSSRHQVSIEDYIHYQRNGYLIVRSLVAPDEVNRLKTWSDDVLHGRLPLPGVDPVAPGTPIEDLYRRFTRIHMLHRVHETAEWGLLLPQVVDTIEALEGPDVLALQSMMFFNPPGQGGQGWHQDSYYIPTLPDSLIGAWIALDQADEENGCLWVVPGSHHEPIYPSSSVGSQMHAQDAFKDLFAIENASHLDDQVNTLHRVVSKYPEPIPVRLNPGDVLFFHSHLLHRSYPNRTRDRLRRAYVCHYCNARSSVPWNHAMPFDGTLGNYLHILARGSTDLPYAKPLFNTPVHLGQEGPDQSNTRMMAMPDGQMMPVSQTREETAHDD